MRKGASVVRGFLESRYERLRTVRRGTAVLVLGGAVVLGALATWRDALGEFVWLFVIAFALVVGWVLVVPEGVWQRIFPPETSVAAKRLALKDRLGEAHSNGQALRAAADRRSIEAWGTETRDLIREALGDGEAALFLSDDGYVFYVDPTTTASHQTWADGRLRRISELIARVDNLTIREEWGPN